MSVKVIRFRELVEMLGISKSSLFDKMNPQSPRYDESFPKRVHIGMKSVGWLEHEIEAWIKSRQ